MDCRDMFYDPINPLPKKCEQCGFPDLDHVPQPYFLVKSRSMSPNELAGAENGNFFVRDRVRRVLDLLAPGQCTYYSTHYKGTSKTTPWFLGVPNHQVVTAKVDPSIARCTACGEPRSAHPGTQWTECLFGTPPREQPLAGEWTADTKFDVLKSATWGSSEDGWDQWISRDLYLSVRFLHLLRKIKAKGFHEATGGKPVSPDKEESAWISDKLNALRNAGIPLHADGTLSNEDAQWLRDYIKGHALESRLEYDIKGSERRLKTKLPKSYLDFIKRVGPMRFENVDEQDGFGASILPPDRLEIETGYAAFEDEDSKSVNPVTFASTDHGDCFCFDAQKGMKEYPVVVYKHEGNFFESYAGNFAACIRRFADANK
jgi:hypothetical protein